MLIDAHCHLDLIDTFEPPPGVDGWFSAGYSPATWRRRAGVWQAFGTHPWAVDGPVDLDLLGRWLEGAVAVGEIGLDRNRKGGETAFRDQLALARERDLPVVLHVVRTHGRVLEILREDGHRGGMVHGFQGPAEMLPAWLEAGFYLSLGERSGPFPEIPLDRLLLETDAPTGRLEGLRGTLERVARERGLTCQALEAATEANLRRLLKQSG